MLHARLLQFCTFEAPVRLEDLLVHDTKLRLNISPKQIFSFRFFFFFWLSLGNISLLGIQKHSRSSWFCSASPSGLACGAIRIVTKGFLASQRKARELFHGLLKSGTKICYSQGRIGNIYKDTTSNFLNPYGNAQGCENHRLTLGVLTVLFETGYQG